MHILVCGGAGYIGSHVVRHLKAAGHNLVVLDSLHTGHGESVPADVPLIDASIGDVGALDRVFRQWPLDAVVHLCALSLVGESVREPLRYYENNVGHGVQLLQAMVRHGVRRMVFSSTAAVYGQPQSLPITEDAAIAPINPYGFSKAAFERILAEADHAYGLKWVALRYFNAAGADASGEIGEDHTPETHLVPIILQSVLASQRGDSQQDMGKQPMPLRVFGDDYPTPDGTCVRDYVHVGDLADAHGRALDYLAEGGESLAANLGNGTGFSVLEVIRECERVTGRTIPFTIGPRREGDPATLVASAERARSVLGWTPTRSSLQMIVETAWNWHRQHPTGYCQAKTVRTGGLASQ